MRRRRAGFLGTTKKKNNIKLFLYTYIFVSRIIFLFLGGCDQTHCITVDYSAPNIISEQRVVRCQPHHISIPSRKFFLRQRRRFCARHRI